MGGRFTARDWRLKSNMHFRNCGTIQEPTRIMKEDKNNACIAQNNNNKKKVLTPGFESQSQSVVHNESIDSTVDVELPWYNSLWVLPKMISCAVAF